MGLLDKMFGGGEKKASKEQIRGLNNAKTYFNPYYSSGINALNKYQNALTPMENPVSYYNNISSQYTPSASFQNRLAKMLDIVNNNYARIGQLGMGKSNKEILDYASGALAEDEQRYLDNIFRTRDAYLAGEGNLMNQGYGAGTQLGGIEEGIGNIRANRARADSQGFAQMLGLGVNTLANYATGGIPGVIKPYTSEFIAEQNRPRVSWERGGYGYA